MALQVSLWSSSPNWCISILTAHKTVVLLNMCCLSALDWNVLHILFLLRRCHMNQEKNAPVGRSAILFHRCLHHYRSNIPKRSARIRSSSFQQTESRLFSFIVPHCLFWSLPLHHSVAHVDNELDEFRAFAFRLLSLVGIAEGKKGLLLSFSSGHIPRGNVKSPKSLATWRDYAHKTLISDQQRTKK
jgi:hypothetical protein